MSVRTFQPSSHPYACSMISYILVLLVLLVGSATPTRGVSGRYLAYSGFVRSIHFLGIGTPYWSRTLWFTVNPKLLIAAPIQWTNPSLPIFHVGAPAILGGILDIS